MKRGGPGHMKTKRLARLLEIPLYGAVGLIELLNHTVANYTPDGGIGRYEDDEIAAELGWEGKPERLVSALVRSGHLDSVEGPARLVRHDWPEHCEDATHIRLARAGTLFADGTAPNLSRLPQKEREVATERFKSARRAHGKRTASRTPTPTPTPTPKKKGAPPSGSAPASGSPEPPPSRGDRPPVEDAWTRGLKAAAAYKPTASSWKLTKARRKALRQLLDEHRSRGADAFAEVVHGYVFRHRRAGESFDPWEHFTADTLLRASKRAERLEAFDEATQQHGLSPPFRPLELRRADSRDRGASATPQAQEDAASRMRREREEQIRAAYEAGEISEPTEEAMREAAARAAREFGERRRAQGPL